MLAGGISYHRRCPGLRRLATVHGLLFDRLIFHSLVARHCLFQASLQLVLNQVFALMLLRFVMFRASVGLVSRQLFAAA